VIFYIPLFYKVKFGFTKKKIYIFMTKRTLSNKTRSSVLKVSGFRARMATAQGKKIIRNRRKKGRKKLAIPR
jgi:ribosomal protein L34